MLKKKELSLQALEKVSGGVLTEEAMFYWYLNYDKIDSIIRTNNSHSMWRKMLQEMLEGEGTSDLLQFQASLTLNGVNVNLLESYNPNNPEHVKKLEDFKKTYKQ